MTSRPSRSTVSSLPMFRRPVSGYCLAASWRREHRNARLLTGRPLLGRVALVALVYEGKPRLSRDDLGRRASTMEEGLFGGFGQACRMPFGTAIMHSIMFTRPRLRVGAGLQAKGFISSTACRSLVALLGKPSSSLGRRTRTILPKIFVSNSRTCLNTEFLSQPPCKEKQVLRAKRRPSIHHPSMILVIKSHCQTPY